MSTATATVPKTEDDHVQALNEDAIASQVAPQLQESQAASTGHEVSAIVRSLQQQHQEAIAAMEQQQQEMQQWYRNRIEELEEDKLSLLLRLADPGPAIDLLDLPFYAAAGDELSLDIAGFQLSRRVAPIRATLTSVMEGFAALEDLFLDFPLVFAPESPRGRRRRVAALRYRADRDLADWFNAASENGTPLGEDWESIAAEVIAAMEGAVKEEE